MPRPAMPTVAEIQQLPCYLNRSVPAEYEDANGHMNITGYLRLHDEALWPLMAELGMDSTYLTERQMSLFDLEHHLRYLDEMRIGDETSVYGRAVARSAKLYHGMLFLVDRTNRRLANTFEFVTAHVSLETRRTTPFPSDVATAIDQLVEEHSGLTWEVPLSGVLSIG